MTLRKTTREAARDFEGVERRRLIAVSLDVLKEMAPKDSPFRRLFHPLWAEVYAALSDAEREVRQDVARAERVTAGD